jgi:hypothetical protein
MVHYNSFNNKRDKGLRGEGEKGREKSEIAHPTSEMLFMLYAFFFNIFALK